MPKKAPVKKLSPQQVLKDITGWGQRMCNVECRAHALEVEVAKLERQFNLITDRQMNAALTPTPKKLVPVTRFANVFKWPNHGIEVGAATYTSRAGARAALTAGQDQRCIDTIEFTVNVEEK